MTWTVLSADGTFTLRGGDWQVLGDGAGRDEIGVRSSGPGPTVRLAPRGGFLATGGSA